MSYPNQNPNLNPYPPQYSQQHPPPFAPSHMPPQTGKGLSVSMDIDSDILRRLAYLEGQVVSLQTQITALQQSNNHHVPHHTPHHIHIQPHHTKECSHCKGKGGFDSWGKPVVNGDMFYHKKCTSCNGIGHC